MIFQFHIPVCIMYVLYDFTINIFFQIILQCFREVLQHVAITVFCNGTLVYSSITYLIQHINDITGLLSVPQYQQCNISIVFINNAGSSEPLVLLLGELL